jgi:hypothetical protein
MGRSYVTDYVLDVQGSHLWARVNPDVIRERLYEMIVLELLGRLRWTPAIDLTG